MTRASYQARRLGTVALGLLALAAAAGSVRAVSRTISEAASLQPGLRIDSEARLALRRQPLDAAALRDLAILRGAQVADGTALLSLSDRVSRRDPETQVQLLEAAAQNGDITATLRHYDVLFSIAPGSHQALFGILEHAIADPVIRARLAPYAERPWLLSLVKSASNRPGQAMLALSLARETGLLAHTEARDEVTPYLTSSLLAEGRAGEAVALAAALGVKDWEDPGISAATLDRRLGSLGWRLESSGPARAQRREPDTLAISVEPGRIAAVARRVTVLAPGQYRLSFSSEAPVQPLARLEWRLSCGGATAERIAFRPRASLQAYRADWAIPANCPVQEWSIWGEGADAQIPSEALLLGLRVGRE